MMIENNTVPPFLLRLEIEASIVPDVLYGNLLVMKTGDYEQHCQWIDPQFRRVRQVGKYSYLKLRKRATGSLT